MDYGLSPGLQQLIERIADTKDVVSNVSSASPLPHLQLARTISSSTSVVASQGLIAYLSAIPGEPHQASRPPAAVARLQRTKSARPKSIMKITKVMAARGRGSVISYER